jgi:transcriptional regulator with XRE-family HTH domain
MKRLELIRKARGLTQRQLASDVGVARQRVSELECGRFIPPVGSDVLYRLAVRLQVNASEARSLLDEVTVDEC